MFKFVIYVVTWSDLSELGTEPVGFRVRLDELERFILSSFSHVGWKMFNASYDNHRHMIIFPENSNLLPLMWCEKVIIAEKLSKCVIFMKGYLLVHAKEEKT